MPADVAPSPTPLHHSTLPRRANELAPSVFLSSLRSLLPLVIGIGLAGLLQFALKPHISEFSQKLLIDIGINLILAVSLNIVNGYTGQFSIGHAGFMALGGYTAGAITYYGSMRLWESPAIHGGYFGPGDWLFVIACISGGVVAAIAGLIVGLPSLRLRGDYLALVTLGFGEIVRVLLQLSRPVLDTVEDIRDKNFPVLFTHLGGALGFAGLPYYTSLFWVWTFVTITVLTAYRLKESTYGLAFLAIRENPIAAEAMGVPVTRYKVLAFVLAAFFGGIAGGLYSHNIGNALNPDELGFQKSFDIVIMVVLGGMGSISGVILAAIGLTLLPELLREFSSYRMIVYAVLLIAVMILRPQGLFGLREIWHWRIIGKLMGKRA